LNIKEKIKAYIDLTRAHFAFVWPILFCTGLFLAFSNYNYFSWVLLIKVALIGLFGFEAGMVLNDIVDHKLDELDVEKENLTRYWRPFNERPIPSGKISLKEAIAVFLIFVTIAALLISTLPFPNFLYIYGFMIYGYGMEIFYQIKKRNQKFPIAQLLGRTDLTFFPVAGYLCYGQFDITVLFIILFMYPWALAHLGANDIVDIKNDKAKNLKTVTILYGIKKNVFWILGFTVLHIITALLFLIVQLGLTALIGFIVSFTLLIIANIILLIKQTPKAGLKILPLFHMSLLCYCVFIILNSVLM
jgi:4-hydroxybenzoate polyprenyltransferase